MFITSLSGAYHLTARYPKTVMAVASLAVTLSLGNQIYNMPPKLAVSQQEHQLTSYSYPQASQNFVKRESLHHLGNDRRSNAS